MRKNLLRFWENLLRYEKKFGGGGVYVPPPPGIGLMDESHEKYESHGQSEL